LSWWDEGALVYMFVWGVWQKAGRRGEECGWAEVPSGFWLYHKHQDFTLVLVMKTSPLKSVFRWEACPGYKCLVPWRIRESHKFRAAGGLPSYFTNERWRRRKLHAVSMLHRPICPNSQSKGPNYHFLKTFGLLLKQEWPCSVNHFNRKQTHTQHIKL
jgi:hypothetical protein